VFESRWYLWPVSQGWWLGFVAVIAGWTVTETGRQPWLVSGILRTADAASPVPVESIATTLVLFVLVYSVVFSMGIYYINRLIARGMEGVAIEAPRGGSPLSPLSSAREAAHEAISSGH